MDLSCSKGKNPLFPASAPFTSDEGSERQRDFLEGHEAGFAERDLLGLRLSEDDGSGDAAGEPFTPEEAAAARREFGVGDGRCSSGLTAGPGSAPARPFPRRISSPA